MFMTGCHFAQVGGSHHPSRDTEHRAKAEQAQAGQPHEPASAMRSHQAGGNGNLLGEQFWHAPCRWLPFIGKVGGQFTIGPQPALLLPLAELLEGCGTINATLGGSQVPRERGVRHFFPEGARFRPKWVVKSSEGKSANPKALSSLARGSSSIPGMPIEMKKPRENLVKIRLSKDMGMA